MVVAGAQGRFAAMWFGGLQPNPPFPIFGHLINSCTREVLGREQRASP
jgi:hypothetical protein